MRTAPAPTPSLERAPGGRGEDGRPRKRLWSDRFVGRERELERIAGVLQDAANGRPRTLLVAGTAGLGASRLLAETGRRLGVLAEQFAVARAVAYPATARMPYAPIAGALERLLAPLDDDSLAALVEPSGDALARLMPGLRSRLDALDLLSTRPPRVETEWRQARILEAALGLLERFGEQRPVVLLLEDIHHADAASRALVTFMARVSRRQRLALIATYQPDQLVRSHPLRAVLASLAGVPSVDTLDLAPFERAELGKLIEAIEGSWPSSTTLLLVAERSGGNALVAEELLAARRELSGVSLAASLDRLVAGRLAVRSPECRRVLRLLSLAGSPVSVSELAAIDAEFERGATTPPPRSASAPRRRAGPLDGDVSAGLAEALDHGFLIEAETPLTGTGSAGQAPDGRGEQHVAFRHELIAAAVAADLLPAVRRRCHTALAAARAAEPARAIDHYLGAGQLGDARAAALAAARASEERDAGSDALVHYDQALGLPEGAAGPGVPKLPELYQRAAEAAFGAGDSSRAVAYAEAAAGALGDHDRLRLGLVMERLGRYWRASGDHDRSLIAHRRAVELVPRAATRARAGVLASLAQVRMLEGTFSEAKRLAQEAVAVADAAGPDARYESLHGRCTQAVSDAWGHDPESAIEELLALKDEAKRLGYLDALFRVYANVTTVLDLVGRREEAIAIAYEGIADAERVGQATVYGNFLRGNAADSLFSLGRWEECRRQCQEALSWSPVGIAAVQPLLDLTFVEVAENAGESAGRLLGQLLLALETLPDPQFGVPAQQAAAAYAMWQDDLPDARRAADRGWEAVRETEDWFLMARMAMTCLEVDATVAIDAQRRRDFVTLASARERTLPILLRAEATVRACGVPPTAGSRRQADLLLRTGRAFRARIEGRDDPAAWGQLALDWAELRDPYSAAKARWREAQALLDRAGGRSTRTVAREPLVAAAEAALALGAWPLLRSVAELSRRAMLPLPRPVQQALEGRTAGPGGASRSTFGRPDGHRPASGAGLARRSAGPVAAPAQTSVMQEFVVPASPSRDGDFGLSRRELEVLALIAEGRTNPEIGRQLYITRKTVAVHVSNILTKLGVSGRVEAAAVAIRLGLTEGG